MYLYFNAQGKLVEIINDTALRKGNDAVDKVFIHFEDADYTEDCYLMVQRADGTHTLEYLVEDTITKQIPYDAKRDLKYFKDYTPYKFYVYTLQNTDLSVEGLTKMTIRLVNGSSTLALGLVTFNVENSVVKDDNGILQSQYDYLLQLIQNKVVDQDNTITVMQNLPSNLSDYDGRYILVKDNDDTFCELYYVEQGVAILQFHLSKYWADSITNRLSQSEQDIDTAEGNITNLQGRMATAESDIDNIEDGTTVVEKALRDSLGNVIKDHYVSSVIPTYDDNTNNFYLNPYNGNDSLMPTRVEGVTLPKATTSKDGLMSKEDKVKVDNIASDISSAITTHDNSATAHLPLRTLINNLQKEVDRINAKGRSWGEIDKTFSELWAMAEPTRSEYISDYILGLFPNFVASDGDLVYTIVSDTEEEHELEYNSTLSQWVDNGAYIVSKASNTQHGIVKGDLDYVSILNGIIQVLKSDYATNIGSNGASYDYGDLLALFTEVANDIYKKNETYSATQIEQRITDLLALANLQDTLIGSYTNGQTVLASDLTPYNFVIVLGKDGDNTYTGTFKPSEIVSGNVVSLSPTVYLTRGATDFTITAPTSVKLWGIKLKGIDASEIAYDGKTVEDALNEIFVPAYVTATHEALQTEITATDAFEINDETGDVIKITGNEPTNLVSNGDLLIAKPSPNQNEPLGFTYINATDISLTNGIVKFTATAYFGRMFRNDVNISIGETVYYFARIKTSNNNTMFYGGNSSTPVPNTNSFEFISAVRTPLISTNLRLIGVYDLSSSDFTPIEVDYMGAYSITDMINKGIKNDSGVSFALLSDAEIKEQMDVWVQNGFPTVVEKLVSKSDNLFNGEFKTLTSLESENLISNSDLIIDSDSDGVPDGFTYGNATDLSLTNGIAKFTATAQYGHIRQLTPNVIDIVNGNTYYFYSKVKTITNNCSMLLNGVGYDVNIVSNGNWQFTSKVFTASSSYSGTGVRINDNSTSDWTPIEVDYMGIINITDLVSRGILPSGLSNNEYKEMIDKAMFTNVPLRETNYIAVEPSKTYKLIKVSANGVTHKVIEYTTDNQVVKVTPVAYTTNKFTFTTHALTSKIKIVSDLMNRVPNLVSNGDLLIPQASPNENRALGFSYIYLTDITLTNGIAKFTATANLGRMFRNDVNIAVGETVYYFARVKTSNSSTQFYVGNSFISVPNTNSFEFISVVKTPVNSTNINLIGVYDNSFSNFTPIEVDYMGAYNMTTFKNAGVVNDTGTLFSRLTNDEIKDQMDIWVQNGFPDHVIHALYPNGVDSAIALKYNDADDIFRPQQIDELPLNLTLRSGEYWQDGYVVKQNGNAEYHPLNTKFSAWNYGQLEAVYTSGLPADFDIQYAQNTAGQVKTTQEFLVEAREQLDYVTEGYDNLVEKLGDAIFSDKYDSYAGITSDTYEYYTLEGIKEGNTLAIQGAGQSIQNLLGKGGTINATITVRGITVTYDSNTGVFTVNGTATAGAAFNITLATGMDFGLPVGTPMQLMRYYDADDGGTVDLNGSYIGYVLVGTSASHRINENSEALYDPYINGSGNLKPNHATDKQYLVLQVWAPGITFTNFKFKIGIYEGLQLRPFILPSGEPAKSNVTVYNRTANKLNMPTALNITDSGLTLTYDPLVQEFLLSGTATATKDISLSATFNVLSGDRLSIKRLYQSGDITGVGGTLPRIKLVNSTNTTIVYNDIYKMTAPEGQTPTPDVSFNTGTAPADAILTLKLGITSGQVFDNYRFRLMIHDKSTDIGYVAYRKDQLGNMSVGANERAVIEFKAIPYGILEFVADSESLNLLFADGITDLNKTYLEYNAGIMSPNRKIGELTARLDLIDNPFRNKVIAVWGDSRESNNPTSDPNGVGDQKDTSWPALLAKKLNATVLNYGLSGGAWAENTVQQDAASAIVNRVLTEDVSASADVIIISSMNDFKLASVLGSPSPDNKDKTTFYGAMRLTYDRLATKYPGKKIVLVLPQKRYDETVNYGGGSYYHYLKAQVEVAKEYGIPIVDLYHNFPNTKPTFYATNMLNDTHFSAVGNDRVAELVARELIGNGNKGDMDVIPPIPTTDGTYTLKVTITGGIPVFSWVVD